MRDQARVVSIISSARSSRRAKPSLTAGSARRSSMEAKRALCMLRCCPLPAWLSKGCRPFQSSQGIHLCDQGWPRTCQNAKAQSACKATRGVVSPLQRPACGSAATTRGDHSPRASPAMSAHNLPPLPERSRQPCRTARRSRYAPSPPGPLRRPMRPPEVPSQIMARLEHRRRSFPAATPHGVEAISPHLHATPAPCVARLFPERLRLARHAVIPRWALGARSRPCRTKKRARPKPSPFLRGLGRSPAGFSGR